MRKLQLLLVTLTLFSCQSAIEDHVSQVLGLDKVEVENNEGESEFGGFGEGYTLDIYQLSTTTLQDFENNASKILPEKDDEDWNKFDWNKTPIDSSYNEIFIMGLNYYSGNQKIETQLPQIKKALEKPNVYYSFYYKPDKDNPQRVELFILDIETKKLYTIQANY